VDNWKWQGGRAEYAGFRGKTKDDFWTDPQLIADFKETIRFRAHPHQHADRRALLR
jgi:mannan endo-1,4-beta-mannosidase